MLIAQICLVAAFRRSQLALECPKLRRKAAILGPPSRQIPKSIERLRSLASSGSKTLGLFSAMAFPVPTCAAVSVRARGVISGVD